MDLFFKACSYLLPTTWMQLFYSRVTARALDKETYKKSSNKVERNTKTFNNAVVEAMMKEGSENQMDDDEVWNTAIFFPDYFPDKENSKTQQLIWYLGQTKELLKICIYTSSFRILENAVFEIAKRKGVHVMAITNVPRVVSNWRKHGVFTREKPKRIRSTIDDQLFVDHMHNKFIIIDDRAVLSGSLNWTRSGITENRENVVITNDKNTVQKYVDEFQHLWEFSEPENTSYHRSLSKNIKPRKTTN